MYQILQGVVSSPWSAVKSACQRHQVVVAAGLAPFCILTGCTPKDAPLLRTQIDEDEAVRLAKAALLEFGKKSFGGVTEQDIVLVDVRKFEDYVLVDAQLSQSNSVVYGDLALTRDGRQIKRPSDSEE